MAVTGGVKTAGVIQLITLVTLGVPGVLRGGMTGRGRAGRADGAVARGLRLVAARAGAVYTSTQLQKATVLGP